MTVLAGVAELAEDIDVARAQEALTAAQQRLEQLRGGRGPSSSSEGDEGTVVVEIEVVEASVRRAEVRLQVAGASAG